MPYKRINHEIRNFVEDSLQEEFQYSKTPVVAMDADGTLWDMDMGEGFFKYEIFQKKIKELPQNPWQHYRELKSHPDPRPAYLWLAQIHNGLPLEEVQSWAIDFTNELSPFPVFDDMKEWIDLFHEKGVSVYIVTASVKWAVEPAAARLGIPSHRVLGFETVVDSKSGLITADNVQEITYKEGKWLRLAKETQNQRPFMSCGNTEGDISLLEQATRVALAVGAAWRGVENGNGLGSGNGESLGSGHLPSRSFYPAGERKAYHLEMASKEEKLRTIALERKWKVHLF